MSASKNRKRLWPQALLGCLALFPVGGSLLVHFSPPAATSAEAGPRKASLAFDQYLVSLGRVYPGEFTYARYHFTNTSDRTVTVTDLQTSCGCLQPRLDKRVYEPGEAGDFFLRVHTVGEPPGAKEYFVNVSYTDPDPQQIELTFKLIVPEDRVSVVPRALIVYQSGNLPTKHEVVVTDFRKDPLSISRVESSSPLVTAELGEPETTAEGHRSWVIQITVAAKVPPGRTQALLTIPTNDLKHERLRVPILIEGPQE